MPYDPTDYWITILIAVSNGLIADTAIVRNSLAAWAQSESNGQLMSSCYNPLAGSHRFDNTKTCLTTTDLAVPLYTSVPEMAEAYLFMWTHDPYVPIIKALQKGTSYYEIWKAINDSPWCGGYHKPGHNTCQGGLYPKPLADLVGDVYSASHHKLAQKAGGRAYTPAGPPSPLTDDMRKHWDELMKQWYKVLPQQLHKAIRYRVIMRNSIKPAKSRSKQF